MFGWLKKNKKNLVLGASLLLNALQTTGVVSPAAAQKAGQVINAAEQHLP